MNVLGLHPDEWAIVGLSLRVALLAVAATFPLGLALAYALARGRLRARFVVENLVQLPLVLPPVVTGLLLLVAVGPESAVGRALEAATGVRLAFSTGGAVLAAAVVAFPFLVQTMRVAFESVDPTWEEAAYVYGGTRWAAFRHVTLPLAAPGIGAAVVLAFARALGEFGATIVLAGNLPGVSRTLPLAVFTRLQRVGGEGAALRLVLVAVAISCVSVLVHAALMRRWRAR